MQVSMHVRLFAFSLFAKPPPKMVRICSENLEEANASQLPIIDHLHEKYQHANLDNA